MKSNYSTNLTDHQWKVIEKIIDPQKRNRRHDLRTIMNAILYLNKTGCQGRMIPNFGRLNESSSRGGSAGVSIKKEITVTCRPCCF